MFTSTSISSSQLTKQTNKQTNKKQKQDKPESNNYKTKTILFLLSAKHVKIATHHFSLVLIAICNFQQINTLKKIGNCSENVERQSFIRGSFSK